MKKIYALRVSFLLPVFLLYASMLSAQESFLISFPQNPPPVSTVCGQSSDLQITLSALAAGSQDAEVKIELAPGIEYVAGSLATINSNKGLTATFAGGTASAPRFLLKKNGAIGTGDNITIKISRTATCAALAHLNSSGSFTDKVIAKLPQREVSEYSTAEYGVRSPVLTFVQPSTQNNAALRTNYNRTFEITNGGNGCTNNLVLNLNHPQNGIRTNSLRITARNGIALSAPLLLTPVSTTGTVYRYAITAAALPNGNFCNGDKLTLEENYTILTCNSITEYSVRWGCETSGAESCQVVRGTGSVSMAEGTPDASFTSSRGGDFKDSCTPYTWNITIKNTGTGDAVAAGMYKTRVRLGGQNASALGTFDFARHRLIKAEVNGKAVPIINGDKLAIAEIDLRNHFSSDPDGPGGLEDLDGDGYYDDLRAGNSISIKITISENCNANVCNTEFNNGVYGVSADVKYTTPCSLAEQTTQKLASSGWTPSGTRVSQLTNTSYSPANVYDNTPFTARFSVGYYALSNKLDTNDTRYAYELILPAGLSLSSADGSAKWFNGAYPGSEVKTSPTVTQNGNVVTIVSPSNKVGYVTLELVYSCGNTAGGVLSIPFKLKRLDNIVTGCLCNADIFCNTLVIPNAVCNAACAQGPSLTFAAVERADNSLGWTDFSMKTLQSRANISAYDLSKALYLDDIEVRANGRQNGNSANLYLKFEVKKHVSNENPLTPKSINITIRRGTQLFQRNSAIFTSININSKAPQQIVWNLSSAIASLPGGQLLDGDLIETVATYQVTSEKLPTQDIQTSEKLYFYNLDSNNQEVSCNYLIPDMYLLTGEFSNGANGGVYAATTACNTLMTHPSFLAYRFNSSGSKYKNEVRPGLLPTQYEVTIPPGFTLDKITYINYDAGTLAQDITASMIRNGNTYTYAIPAAVHNILVVNNYNLNFHVYIKPTCGVAPSQIMNVKFKYLPHYYHHARHGTTPAEVLSQKNYPVTYDATTKPAIEVVNLSGDIQAYRPTENHRFRIVSTGTTTAPYIWFSIPDNPNLIVKKVTDLATKAEMTGIPYSGGMWYQVSAAGLASSAYRDFQVDYGYTSCNATTFAINAGWNCSAYPADPVAYGCAVSSVALQFIPQMSVIQLAKVENPPAVVNMCDILSYQYTYISAGAGNSSNNKFSISLPLGASFVSGSILAEYPLASGNWQPVTFFTDGSSTTLDLATHPGYNAALGLPGTLSDGGDPSRRQIGIKFQVTSNCSFISKSSLKLTIFGNNSCGSASAGNENSVFSDPINILGTETDYRVQTRVNSAPTLFDNCATTAELDITQTIVSGVHETGDSGEILINLPSGYDYVALKCNTDFCPEYLETFTDAATSQAVVRLSLPSGMESGDFTRFQLLLAANAVATACGNHTIFIDTVDKNSGVTCSATGISCREALVSTGSFNFNYTISKPAYAIQDLSGSFVDGFYSGNITIRNTSLINSSVPINVDLYCADASGVSTGQLLGTFTIGSSLNAGASVTEPFRIAGSSCSVIGRVVASVRAGNNCVCTDSNSPSLFCFKDSTAGGPVLNALHGITSLNRAGAQQGNWPMVRKGAWTVLESKSAGFVINRLSDVQITQIPDANLVAGMMVYSTTQQCLMLNVDGTKNGWKCYNNQACPD